MIELNEIFIDVFPFFGVALVDNVVEGGSLAYLVNDLPSVFDHLTQGHFTLLLVTRGTDRCRIVVFFHLALSLL